MDRKDQTFFFGQWQVEPKANSLRLGKRVKQLEPKAMDVLLLLCQHEGEVLSSDDIVSHCWPDMVVGDNPLHKTINQLRRALGDSATSPTYIETIRKRGYRTLAEVTFPVGHEQSADTQTWQSGSPFPGLQAYSPKYAQVFYGRSAQITTLLDRISQQISYGRDFCLVLGPSGSGKSSLINAGVIPNLSLAQGYKGNRLVSYSSLDFADVSGDQLYVELASCLLDWELNDLPVFDGDSADTLAQKLMHEPNRVIATCQSRLKASSEQGNRFALFIDRLEVLLSSPAFENMQRQEFVELLELFATSGAVLVLSACRNDFYPLLVSYPSLMAGKARGAHFDLAPPSRHELLQMIRLPAKAAGLEWDTDSETHLPLDELLCLEAVDNPDALPMLQYTLQALYLERSDDNKLLASVYRKLGGIEGAIGKNAEQAINNLGQEQQSSLARVLSQLVTLRDDEQSVTSRSALWSQLQSEAEQALVQAMVDSRLFVSHLQNNQASFSIAHEALLRRWPRATEWIEAHKDSLSVKVRLSQTAKRWQQEAHHKAYLLAEGKPLQEAQTLSRNPLFSIGINEQEFIQASAKRASRLRWIRRLTAGVLGILTLISVVMSYRSFEAEQQALEKRLAAEDLLGFMVGDFADKMRGIGRMDLLDGISNKALDYFSGISLNDANLSFETRFQHAQTLEAMAEVAYSRNKIDEASTALLAAKQAFDALLLDQPDNLSLLKSLGANAFWLGQLEYDESNWQGAKPWFEQYLVYSQRMYDLAPQDKDALMELSYAHNSLGSLSMKQQRFRKARTSFEQSLELKKIAFELEPSNTQLLAGIADTESWLASAVESDGLFDYAIEIHERIQKSLDAGNYDENYLLVESLAFSYQKSRRLLQYQNGRKHDAIDKAIRNYNLFKTLIKVDDENKKWLNYFFRSQLYLLELMDESSLEKYNLSPPIIDSDWRSYTKSEKVVYDEDTEILMYLNFSKYYLARNDFVMLDKYFKLGYELVNQSYKGGNVKYLSWLAEFELIRASKFSFNGERNKMIDACSKAYKVLLPAYSKNKEVRVLIPYAKSLKCMDVLSDNADVVNLLTKADIYLY